MGQTLEDQSFQDSRLLDAVLEQTALMLQGKRQANRAEVAECRECLQLSHIDHHRIDSFPARFGYGMATAVHAGSAVPGIYREDRKNSSGFCFISSKIRCESNYQPDP